MAPAGWPAERQWGNGGSGGQPGEAGDGVGTRPRSLGNRASCRKEPTPTSRAGPISQGHRPTETQPSQLQAFLETQLLAHPQPLTPRIPPPSVGLREHPFLHLTIVTPAPNERGHRASEQVSGSCPRGLSVQVHVGFQIQKVKVSVQLTPCLMEIPRPLLRDLREKAF